MSLGSAEKGNDTRARNGADCPSERLDFPGHLCESSAYKFPNIVWSKPVTCDGPNSHLGEQHAHETTFPCEPGRLGRGVSLRRRGAGRKRLRECRRGAEAQCF